MGRFKQEAVPAEIVAVSISARYNYPDASKETALVFLGEFLKRD